LYDVVRVVRERCVKSFLDVIIASMLMEKASWGYEIIANIHEKLHILLSPGPVYQVLYSMEKQGLIQSVKDEENGRRRFYHLTEKGLKWCKEMLKASRQAYDLIAFFELKREIEQENNKTYQTKIDKSLAEAYPT